MKSQNKHAILLVRSLKPTFLLSLLLFTHFTELYAMNEEKISSVKTHNRFMKCKSHFQISNESSKVYNIICRRANFKNVNPSYKIHIF